MTNKQKKFVMERLIPFILRDRGRGFEMAHWARSVKGLKYFHHDLDKNIIAPACGTACCIGGSIEWLKTRKRPEMLGDYETVGAMVGWTSFQSNRLFSAGIRWPEPFASKYREAKTPLQQAKVAAGLLKKVVETDGKVLDEQ